MSDEKKDEMPKLHPNEAFGRLPDKLAAEQWRHWVLSCVALRQRLQEFAAQPGAPPATSMRLWLIERNPAEVDCEEWQSAFVRAETEAQARQIMSEQLSIYGRPGVWQDPGTTCREIDPQGPAALILGS